MTESIDEKRERLARERAERRKAPFRCGLSRVGDRLRDCRTDEQKEVTDGTHQHNDG